MKAILPILLILPSCASIVSTGEWPIAISAHPSNASVEVFNDNGVCIHRQRTPFVVTLQSGDGWFAAAHYRVRATSDTGHITETEIGGRLNGWYWGNLLFPGLVGLLIVDPLTGAMYRLPDSLVIPIGAATSAPLPRS